LHFGTAGSVRATITSGGNFLIGTTTDNGVDKLQVSGSAIVSTNLTVGNPYASPQETLNVKDRGYFVDSKYQYLRVGMSSDRAVISSDWYSGAGGTTPPLAFQTASVDRLVIASTGAATFNNSVTVSGTLTAATIVKSGGTSSQFLMADGSTSLGSGGSLSGTTNYVAKFTSSSAIGNSSIFDNGNISLRTTASPYAVNMNTGANSGIGFYQDGSNSSIIGTNQDLTTTNFLSIKGAGIELAGTGSTNASLKTNGNNRLQVLSSGRILIGTTLPTDNTVDAVQINGSISGIGFKQAYVTKTGAYTATDADYVIDCTTGTFTVTLPASSGRTGRILIIKNSGAGTITVDGNAAETIDGAATYAISVQYGTIQIMSDGTNWKIISKF
jgi:hypothetical protein